VENADSSRCKRLRVFSQLPYPIGAKNVTSELMEKLAALAFWQWQSWTRYFLQGKHKPKDLQEWIDLLGIKYADLPEEKKKDYRFWAKKAMEIINNGK
jgi:hypothetical protein